MNCPICNKPAVRRCRCLRGHMGCVNGHEWHQCTVHRVTVIAPSDHSAVGCTCSKGVLWSEEAVGQWHEKTFSLTPEEARKAVSLRVVQEAVELAIAAGCLSSDIAYGVFEELEKEKAKARTTGATDDDLQEEAADVQIALRALAGRLGFSLEEAVSGKMKINLTRRWDPVTGERIRRKP